MNAVRAAFASLTAGQRWTASLAVVLGVVVLVFGLPQQTRSLAPLPANAAAPGPVIVPAAPAPVPVVLPPLQLAALPPLSDLGLGTPAPAPTTTTTTTAPPTGPPPPPAMVCTPPLGVTLTGIEQLDALICVIVASLPVL